MSVLIAFVYVMHSDQLYIGNTGVAFLWLTFDFNLFYDSSQFRMSKIFVPQQIQLLNIHSLSHTDYVVPRYFIPNPFVTGCYILWAPYECGALLNWHADYTWKRCTVSWPYESRAPFWNIVIYLTSSCCLSKTLGLSKLIHVRYLV